MVVLVVVVNLVVVEGGLGGGELKEGGSCATQGP